MLSQSSIDDYYRTLYEEVKKEVSSQTDSYLLSVDIGEYVDFLFNKHIFTPIEYDANREISIEKIRGSRVVSDYERNINVEFISARIHIPILPNEEIGEILELRASTFNFSPPEMSYNNGDIITEADVNESEIQKAINGIKVEVDRRNKDICRCNEAFKTQIRNIIAERKSKIKNEEESFEQIAKKIPVVLQRRDRPISAVFPQVRIKEKIKPIIPPKASQPEELQLRKEQFDAILGLINNTCLGFEITPSTFSKLQEEDLRDIILSNLNGVFEGEAHGEVFSRFGKTDIYLMVSKGGIFIAECKIWDGQKSIGDAVLQILNYLTWRNSHGLVILFSRNKGFKSSDDCFE